MKNPFIPLVQLPIRFYRAAISPLSGGCCRFYPSCSSYALEALETHGFCKGLYLSVRRVLRCNPWSGNHFHDPVPKRFTWRDIIGYNRNRKLKP